MSATSLRVAAWQCAPDPLNVAGNLARLEQACARAAAAGVDVLVTPEVFLTGYAADPAELRRLAEASVGPLAHAVADVSTRSGVAIAYGYAELGDDGAVYDAAQLVDGQARLVNHRKAHLFGELDRARYAPAGELSGVVRLRGRQVALRICYEIEFPESARAAALAGAEAVLVPTANMVGYEVVPRVLVPARAYENGCFVAYANYVGVEGELRYGGFSTIAGPGGDVLAAAGPDNEVLVIAELSGTPATGVGLPSYLADRRPELYG